SSWPICTAPPAPRSASRPARTRSAGRSARPAATTRPTPTRKRTMAKPAPIRLAGTIAATALCLAAATEAASQTPPQDSVVLNQQLQLGDVFAEQTLNVVDAQDQVTVTTSAQGNSAAGAVESGGALTVQSEQDMRADVGGRTDVVLGGDTYGQVNVTTRAGGNNLAVSAYGSDLTANAVQSTSGGLVRATSEVGDSSARLHAGGQVAASAVSNSVALYGEGSFLQGEVDQTNAATVRAFGRIESQYIP